MTRSFLEITQSTQAKQSSSLVAEQLLVPVLSGEATKPIVPQPTVYTETNYSFLPTNAEDGMDSQSLISSASTALDLDGHGTDLPRPPEAARLGKDFVRTMQ